MRVVAFAPDLMDRSKIAAVVPDVVFVGLGGLADVEADLVLVDLSRPGAADALPQQARWVGFASHVDHDLFDLGHVLPRSRFFASLPALLAEL